jgi:hypothetical protein
MAYKQKPAPYSYNVIPIYNSTLEEGVLGKADRRGGILINKEIKDPAQLEEVISHEKIHIEQMQRGDLDYDEQNVYWKGKTYSRSQMKEGAKDLPWEVEAYKNM